jgi:DNA adenine methylase
MKPFVKWVGGKTQILGDVLSLFPKCTENYYEPFLGGGSVLLGVLSSDMQITGKVYASDINPGLIRLYQDVQSNVEGLIVELKKLSDVFVAIDGTHVNRKPSTLEEALTSQESYYYWIREKFRKESTSAMFLFLNKTCFRGVYREGPSGFNVPFEHKKHTNLFDEDHLRKVAILIKDVVFTVSSFEDVLPLVKPSDFVYLDPPYVPLNATSFVGYTSDGFDKHETLFKMCHRLNMVMSNADVPLIKEVFANYHTKIISCRRAIHSKDPSKRVNEILISTRPM